MPEDNTSPTSTDQHEAAAAERASLEVRDQIARAQRLVDRAREVLSGGWQDVERDEESRTG